MLSYLKGGFRITIGTGIASEGKVENIKILRSLVNELVNKLLHILTYKPLDFWDHQKMLININHMYSNDLSLPQQRMYEYTPP